MGREGGWWWGGWSLEAQGAGILGRNASLSPGDTRVLYAARVGIHLIMCVWASHTVENYLMICTSDTTSLSDTFRCATRVIVM